MFGYVDISKNTEDGRRGLWQTFMCGLCISTKKLFGNLPRPFISNDINFFNVLFHSVENVDVEVEKHRCVSSPIKKRPILKMTELTDKMAVANVLLTYWNIYDDVVDGKSVKKKAALRTFAKPYKRAQKLWPELDESIKHHYEQLRQAETENSESLDLVAHHFAELSRNFCKLILAESSETAETLCYNLGKWIYLIDALDDAEKDIKRKNYNPFVACYKVEKAKELVKFREEISFEMFAVLNRIAQSYNDLNLVKYNCVLDNVLFDSIRQKTKKVLTKLDTENKK